MPGRKRILVVDDSQFLASILSTTLQGAGYDCTLAHTVKAAVKSLKDDGVPDLVVMDINLPDMMGDAACAAIRRIPACAKLPVVFISGGLDEALQATVDKVGANGYLRKPFSPSSILRWIRDNAHLLEVMEKLRVAPGSRPPKPGSLPPPAPPGGAAAAGAPAPAKAVEFEGRPMDGGVLVIDDSSFLRSVLRETLEGAGYPAALTGSMGAGISMLKAFKPGLILLDINLPDMAGDEACVILKSVPDCKHIPVILMSSATDEVLKAKTVAARANGYLRKPFTPATVLEWLKTQKWVRPLGSELEIEPDAFTMPSASRSKAPAAPSRPPAPSAPKPASASKPPPPRAGAGTGSLSEVLLTQLGNADPEIRAQAAYSLGEAKNKEALPQLRAMLRDEDPQVVADVLWALAEMHDVAAVADIANLLRSDRPVAQDLNLRMRAVESLGRLGDKQAIKAIALCLGEDRPKDERLMALKALADLGDEGVREDLQRVLFEDESEVTAFARETLARINSRTAPPPKPGGA